MSTASLAPAVPEGANRLITQRLTGLAEFTVVWYAYCNYPRGVGICSRNILPDLNVYSGGAG
jgi:hypothetical protein